MASIEEEERLQTFNDNYMIVCKRNERCEECKKLHHEFKEKELQS